MDFSLKKLSETIKTAPFLHHKNGYKLLLLFVFWLMPVRFVAQKNLAVL